MREPISVEGYDLLTKEFAFLKNVHKPQVAHEKQVAACMGDRSENAEYHAAKEKLRHIDKRLRYLNSMIEKSQIIDPATYSHAKVSFGSSVTIEELDSGIESHFTICGVLETEVENGLISIHAPLARAMLGKGVGDEFFVQLPNGKKEYEIVALSYQNIFSLKKNIRTEADFAFH